MAPITDTKAVRRLAPEDVRVGSYVIPMGEVLEFLCRCDVVPGAIVVRRFEITATDDVRVYRVVGVFLPYVHVRDAHGAHATLDLRMLRLGKVPKGLGKLVHQSLRADKRRERKGKKK